MGNVAGYLVNFALVGVPYDWRIMLGLGIVPASCVLIILVLPYRKSILKRAGHHIRDDFPTPLPVPPIIPSGVPESFKTVISDPQIGQNYCKQISKCSSDIFIGIRP